MEAMASNNLAAVVQEANEGKNIMQCYNDY